MKQDPSRRRLAIRECGPDDSEALHAVFEVVARERRFLARVEAPPVEQVRAFTESVRGRGGVRIAALDGDRIVGWCDIDPDAREGFRHCGRLGMGLLRTHRGQGHGRALLEAALAMAGARGLSRIELEVFESNAVAIRLYERLGFRREGTRLGARILDGRTDDLVLMARLGGASSGPLVSVFFYGSYMNRAVLGEVGLAPRRWEPAALAGFDIRIAPRANLVRAPGQLVFGVLALATHAELERLYDHARDVLGGVYLPEAVLVQAGSGAHEPALCYLAPRMVEGPVDPGYLDRILEPARELGFPASYLTRLEAFRPSRA